MSWNSFLVLIVRVATDSLLSSPQTSPPHESCSHHWFIGHCWSKFHVPSPRSNSFRLTILLPTLGSRAIFGLAWICRSRSRSNVLAHSTSPSIQRPEEIRLRPSIPSQEDRASHRARLQPGALARGSPHRRAHLRRSQPS